MHACKNTAAVVITIPLLSCGPYSICSIQTRLPCCCPLCGHYCLVYPWCCQVHPLYLFDSSLFPSWIKHSPLTYSYHTSFLLILILTFFPPLYAFLPASAITIFYLIFFLPGCWLWVWRLHKSFPRFLLFFLLGKKFFSCARCKLFSPGAQL